MSWSRVRIGSSAVTGPSTTHTTITAFGARLFSACLRGDGQLLVSADVYVQHGRRLGDLADNMWRTADPTADLVVAPKRVAIRHEDTVLLSVWRRDDELMVTGLDLETRDGKRCELDSYGRFALWTPGAQLPERQSNVVIAANLDRIDLATLAMANAS